jgi:hypothetical protein
VELSTFLNSISGEKRADVYLEIVFSNHLQQKRALLTDRKSRKNRPCSKSFLSPATEICLPHA